MNSNNTNLHTIIEKRELTDSTFVLRVERNGLTFQPGQHVQVGTPDGIHMREYSLYSSPNDAYLEFLVKEVKTGVLTPLLKKLKVGDAVRIHDAVGYFNIDAEQAQTHSYLFIASGTGISPFHSFTQTFPQLNYKLIHGIREAHEAYERQHYDTQRYVACTSRDALGDFNGRVTDWLKQNPVAPDTLCYVCGNCNMIFEVFDILEKQGIGSQKVFTEVYF